MREGIKVIDCEGQEVTWGGRSTIRNSLCDLLRRSKRKTRFTLLHFVLRSLMSDQVAVTCQAAVVLQPFKLGISVW